MDFVRPDLAESPNKADSILTADQTHLWSSKIVEKCAEAERHVLRLLRVTGNKSHARSPLAKKIEMLRKRLAEHKGALPANKIIQWLDRLQPMSELRTELVHSRLSIATIEGRSVAILWNAADDPLTDLWRVVLTFDQLKRCHTELSHIANYLCQVAHAAEGELGPPLSRG